MVISDLCHLEDISEEIAELSRGGRYAAANADAKAIALGDFTVADIKIFNFASALPNGGSIAFASAHAFAFAYTPPMSTPSRTPRRTSRRNR